MSFNKKEYDEEFDELDYVGGKLLWRIIIVCLIFGVVGTFTSMEYKKYRTEKEREIFKESTAYNESAASFLADSYIDYNEAETEADKKTVMQYVRMRYPNLEADKIENDMLRQFYNKCMKGE